MREHAHLPAMVGFVSDHVAKHFRANRPRLGPAVPAKLLDAPRTTAERFREHLRATSGALGQSRSGLLRSAAHAIELPWNLQVRSRKPDPFGADIMYMREDRGNIAHLIFAGRLRPPGARVKMFDKHLVDAIVDEKNLGGRNPGCASVGLSVNLGLARAHGFLLLDR